MTKEVATEAPAAENKKPRWGARQLDPAYADALRREIQAEERRSRMQRLMDRAKRRASMVDAAADTQFEAPSYDECIFSLYSIFISSIFILDTKFATSQKLFFR